jgi:predicted nucleic acid-binding protein
MILAAALRADCDVLFTEDLSHGQKIGSLTVVNPFVSDPV